MVVIILFSEKIGQLLCGSADWGDERRLTLARVTAQARRHYYRATVNLE
jgi:hypothetical protein